MHSFGTVWRQDTAILPYTSCDGQAGLVPHGFRERQLMGGETEGWGGRRRGWKWKSGDSGLKQISLALDLYKKS